MRHASSHGENIHAQLLRAREVVQNYYMDNIAQHERAVDSNLMDELNSERAKLCQMVVVSCREIENLRTQLIQQANDANLNERDKKELITSTQRVFSEAEAAKQKYHQLETMFYNVANHILVLQQERDCKVQENIQLQASLRALDFHRSQEVAGVTSQLEQQTSELSAMKAHQARETASFRNALSNMELQYEQQLQNFDRSLSCLLYTSPSPRDQRGSRMPSSA